MLSDRDDLLVYTTVTRPAVQSADEPVVAVPAAGQTGAGSGTQEPALRQHYRSTDRAVRAAHREPLAILPWVGVLATIIWLPVAVLGVLWLFIAYRRGYRGVLAAAIALVVVVTAHWFNGHLVQPFF